MLFCFASFSSGDSGFNGGFARINRCGCWLLCDDRLSRNRLLFSFAGLSAGDSGFDGGFTWIGCGRLLNGRFNRCAILFSFSGARLGLARFASGDSLAIIRFGTSQHDNRLRGITLFFTNARQGGVNGVLIFGRWLYRSLFMTLLTRDLIPLQTSLTRFEARFCFCGTLLFLSNRVDFGFFLTEILHQWDIAWANPGAGTAFDTICEVVTGCFVVLLTFTKPVQLLWQQIGRTGVGAGATANAAFFLFRLAHFRCRRGQQTVGDFYHWNIKPRQGEAHQRTAHNHHWLSARAETGVFKQMADRGTQSRPDVTRTRNCFTG